MKFTSRPLAPYAGWLPLPGLLLIGYIRS
jgi:hypothetical protein